MDQTSLVVGIGGAAGDGTASAGDTLALSLARQGLPAFAYNSYQSVIRGGHSYLRMRISAQKPLNHGDQVDILIALNQDTMDRHLQEMAAGGLVLFNSVKIKPSYEAPKGVQLCPLPVPDLSAAAKTLPVMQNTVAIGALIRLTGLDFSGIETVLKSTFKKKPDVVKVNVEAAKAGYDYAGDHFKPHAKQLSKTNKKWAWTTGNELMAMGAALAGCKFYCAYPMSPATHILEWMAPHAKDLDICIRQVEDEISVINMTIGAAHMGVRSMCATSGGGFALMTEAIGMASIIETPVVVVNVMRGGPSTGLPTRTEQADLNQAFGASQGDFQRIIMAPISMSDCFTMPALAFNLADRFQCPVMILSDALIAENHEAIETSFLDVEFPIDRGELITETTTKGDGEPYLRYKNTPSGISPRAVPGLPGYLYTATTDEHDEDGVIISDVYTDPVRRKKMVDKRARKFDKIFEALPPLKLEGQANADVTLVGWGATWGVISEAAERLTKEGVSVNHLHFKILLPFQTKEAQAILGKSKKIVVVEANATGQFARHMRAEAGITAHAHIRKYDGEPFEPKHIVAGVKEVLRGQTLVEVLSTEAGWRTEHPSGTSGPWEGLKGGVPGAGVREQGH